jgi:hypothetical protein
VAAEALAGPFCFLTTADDAIYFAARALFFTVLDATSTSAR